MPNSSLDTFTLRMVARKVSPLRRAEWVHDHHQNHHEQHVWSPPIIITITTIISDLFTEESRVAMLPIRVFVPDTTALPSFTFFGIILIGLIILIIIVVRVLVPEKKTCLWPKKKTNLRHLLTRLEEGSLFKAKSSNCIGHEYLVCRDLFLTRE